MCFMIGWCFGIFLGGTVKKSGKNEKLSLCTLNWVQDRDNFFADELQLDHRLLFSKIKIVSTNAT